MSDSLAKIYTQLMDSLIEQALHSSWSLRNKEAAWAEDLRINREVPVYFDLEAIRKHFYRNELWQTYMDAATSSEQRLYQAMAAKMQADWIASVERDFRMRRMTHVQALMRAASRRHGHADKNGVIRKGIAYEPQAILEKAQQRAKGAK